MKGIVKSLKAKSFGFIACEGMGQDVFFHSNSLVGVRFDELRPGDSVGVEVEQSKNGFIAIRVERNGHSVQSPAPILNSDAFPPSAPVPPVAVEPTAVEPAPELISVIKALNDRVIRRLAKNPHELYQLHPGLFEELIAEIYTSEGYTTELVGNWNEPDGGIDIIAIRREINGFPIKFAIQCKRYSSKNLITAEPIRALAGVLDRFHAHAGVIATTSYFTVPAKEEVEAHHWKINLSDYDAIVASLKRLDLLKA